MALIKYGTSMVSLREIHSVSDFPRCKITRNGTQVKTSITDLGEKIVDLLLSARRMRRQKEMTL
jgi:hypothetical protein